MKLKRILYHSSKVGLVVELVILYIIFPLFVAFNPWKIPLMLILMTAGIGVWLLLKYDKSFDNTLFINWKEGKKILKPMLIMFLLSSIIMVALIFIIDKDKAFYLIKFKWWLLVIISIFYPIFSVIPQSLIYRALFFHRYDKLFGNPYLKIILSAAFFSFGHILYKNWLVLLLAFVAGLIFSIHYYKSKSLAWNVVEHSLYGVVLFGSGLGYFFVSHFVQ
jgi:membrane protease YdiL (CAAX protease family)